MFEFNKQDKKTTHKIHKTREYLIALGRAHIKCRCEWELDEVVCLLSMHDCTKEMALCTALKESFGQSKIESYSL